MNAANLLVRDLEERLQDQFKDVTLPVYSVEINGDEVSVDPRGTNITLDSDGDARLSIEVDKDILLNLFTEEEIRTYLEENNNESR